MVLKNNSRRITYGIGCVWGMPSLSPLSSLGFDQKKKNITYKVLVVALNKNSNFYHFFPTFSLNADFFQVWKISRQISRLFQEFKTLYEPWEQPWSLETIRGFTITLRSWRNFQLGENFLSYCWYDVLWFWNERRIGESRNSAKWDRWLPGWQNEENSCIAC